MNNHEKAVPVDSALERL